MSAAADSPIDKVLCTTSSIPVAQANSKDIYAATSTAGCYIESYIWRRTSDGYIIYQLFGTENVEVEITLRALDGWYFSDAVAVYLNNSPANFYIGEGGKTLTLTVGYSHPVEMAVPDGLTVETPTPNKIIVSGADNQKVGQFAAEVREKRPPEPYKGKGIKYTTEHIRRKEGKTGAKGKK
jgi:hypothetical protein